MHSLSSVERNWIGLTTMHVFEAFVNRMWQWALSIILHFVYWSRNNQKNSKSTINQFFYLDQRFSTDGSWQISNGSRPYFFHVFLYKLYCIIFFFLLKLNRGRGTKNIKHTGCWVGLRSAGLDHCISTRHNGSTKTLFGSAKLCVLRQFEGVYFIVLKL